MNLKLRKLACLLSVATLALGTAGCTSSTAQGVLISAHDSAQETATPVTAVVGMVSPNFSLLDYEGKRHQLSEYRGKLLLLNFWASWCGPCRQELPDLAAASQELRDRVQLVGVNLASQDAANVSKDLLQRHHISYPNLLDTDGSVADAYGIMVIPTSFLLDANGKILQKIQGPLTKDSLEKLLPKTK
ncbi:TlpA family protein disulfide reductase [Tumebacillus sp. ITR2]|uniref:TlpA family protein disulfide reductase n=1 Tax=Tumebacillus amylolyticus TaxID=2801339 RepID=A0ABS1JBF3_9BACL|nr:TlpA disulfide reductase family protein [Tumebacillus amylolyticus]MBL0387593.1 TlpA family protein disulfide reductase [Tumebacillus amylolyticus]